MTEDRTLQNVGSLWPAIATLAAGAAFLLPLRARSKNSRVPKPDSFAAALAATVEVAPWPIAQTEPVVTAPGGRDLATENNPSGDNVAGTDIGSADDDHYASDDHHSGDNHHAAKYHQADDNRRARGKRSARDMDPIGAGEIGVEPERARRRNDEQRTTDVASACNPRSRTERKVPLTRLPLRRQTDAVGWPLLLGRRTEACTRDARHQLLAEFARAGCAPDEAVLIAAYRQEDAVGRALALRGLKLRTSSDVRAIFEEALREGSDDERAAAVEALTLCGPRESLVTALNDGVDAIAARAALGFVGSRERADYHVALTPFVDSARIDTLLALLAGYLE